MICCVSGVCVGHVVCLLVTGLMNECVMYTMHIYVLYTMVTCTNLYVRYTYIVYNVYKSIHILLFLTDLIPTHTL